MSGNAQKTPFTKSLTGFAQRQVASAIKQQGRALPCSIVSRTGQIVTVKFEMNSAPFTLPQITIPIATSVYDWEPLQPGDRGITMPADAYTGGVSGLGGGVAGLTQQGNLSSLMFVPISNKAWTVPDTNQRVVQGPTGVLLQDTGAAATINLTPTSITLACGGHSIIINSTGVIIDGRVFLLHEHSGVQTGANNTGHVV